MALPKQKERREPRARDSEKPVFNAYWNRHQGTVDTQSDYIQAACREAKGFFRGARIR